MKAYVRDWRTSPSPLHGLETGIRIHSAVTLGHASAPQRNRRTRAGGVSRTPITPPDQDLVPDLQIRFSRRISALVAGVKRTA